MKTSVTRAQWLATIATSFQSDFDHDIINKKGVAWTDASILGV